MCCLRFSSKRRIEVLIHVLKKNKILMNSDVSIQFVKIRCLEKENIKYSVRASYFKWKICVLKICCDIELSRKHIYNICIYSLATTSSRNAKNDTKYSKLYYNIFFESELMVQQNIFQNSILRYIFEIRFKSYVVAYCAMLAAY